MNKRGRDGKADPYVVKKKLKKRKKASEWESLCRN